MADFYTLSKPRVKVSPSSSEIKGNKEGGRERGRGRREEEREREEEFIR